MAREMDIKKLLNEALGAIDQSADAKALEAVEREYAGKKGRLSGELKNIGKLPEGKRKAMGKKIAAIMQEERQKFVTGALAQGYDQQLADRVHDLRREALRLLLRCHLRRGRHRHRPCP